MTKRSGAPNLRTVAAEVGRVALQEAVELFLVATQGGLYLGTVKHGVGYPGNKVHGGVVIHGSLGPVGKGVEKHAAE